MQETWVRSLGWEDPLEEEEATHSNILAWEIPWTEMPDGLQSMGSQRGRHELDFNIPVKILLSKKHSNSGLVIRLLTQLFRTNHTLSCF